MNNYQTEEEFLANYDSSQFEKLSMTTDILVVGITSQDSSNYRKSASKCMSILLTKRRDYPYKDKWCLPGGFLNPRSETLEECAKRVLKSETNIKDLYLEQLYTFDSLDRDPRMRIISTSYVGLTFKDEMIDTMQNVSWFDIIDISEDDNIVTIKLSNGYDNLVVKVKKQLREKTTDRYNFISLDKTLAFDHDIVLLSGLERLKNKLNYTDIVFNMMGDYFTLGELQQVYEVILNKKLLAPAFRRIIAGKVIKTNKVRAGLGHRPSVLYRYKNG